MSSDLEVNGGTVSLAVAVIESALDLTRPGKANEGDEPGLACIAARASHDFFDPTRSDLLRNSEI
jgi:hypothetical protein